MERTDDTTVPNITADLIYKGALGNSGEDLWLYDGNNNLIDEANFSIGWNFGDNTTKQTIEKTSAGWQTSKDAGGTPSAQNSQSEIASSQAPRNDGIQDSADSARNDDEETGTFDVAVATSNVQQT